MSGTGLTGAGEGGAISSLLDGSSGGNRGDGSNHHDGGSGGGRNDATANRGDGRARAEAGDLGSGDATLDGGIAEAAPHGGPLSADASDIIGPDGSICTNKVDPATLLGAPIIPPYAAAGLDLFGGPLGNGAEGWDPKSPSSFHYDPSLERTQPSTLSDVMGWLCVPPFRISVVTGDGGALMTVNEGVSLDFYPYGGYALYFDAPAGALNSLQLEAWGGYNGDERIYQGTMEATASGGTHYSVGLGRPILKTPPGGVAAPLVFPTEAANPGPPSAATKSIVNELYGALLTQFLPSEPVPADCFAASACNVVAEPGTTTYPDGVPPTVGQIDLAYQALHLKIGVRVVPGTGAFEPGNSVDEVDLYATAPSLDLN